jgi:colanic acid biosynthesis glycosyl transferase WcaI
MPRSRARECRDGRDAPLRILVLNQYFHPDQSATSQLLTELCEDLAEHHEVYVVTGRPSYNPTETTASRGMVSRENHGRVRVARVWSTSFDRAHLSKRLLNYGTYLLTSCIGALSIGSPDVVVALTDPPPIGLIGALTGRLRRSPFVLVTKDIFPDVAIRMGKLHNRGVIRLLRRVSATLFENADKVVSIGRDMDRRLAELGVPPAKVETIHDWADGRLIRPLPAPSGLRRANGWEGKFVVMHSGNVGLSQSLDTVVEAADLLRDRPEILFAVVGEGASKSPLQQEGARRRLDNLVFLPYQPKASLAESLGAADVHLVSLKRGLAGYIVPSKVYGIMAAGKPFIAAVEKGSEPAMIVEEHGCGVLIEPGDPVALADAVVRMAGEPLEEMGRRGREAFERAYDRPIATAAYRELLEGLLHARRRRVR